MLRALAVLVVLAGCVDDAEEPTRIIEVSPAEVSDVNVDEPDLCALAATLSSDNVCSLICDPEAMARKLADDGMAGACCYQLRCALGEDVTISVGVCLP